MRLTGGYFVDALEDLDVVRRLDAENNSTEMIIERSARDAHAA